MPGSSFPRAVEACRVWFGDGAPRLAPLSGGGFSGCPVWLVEPADPGGDRFVLKAFADGWTSRRAEDVHRLAAAARRAGLGQVPLPVTSPRGETVHRDRDGTLWEMTEWRSGQPVAAPSREQAGDALATLARLHRAIADAWRVPAAPVAVPAWERRRAALERVAEHGWAGRRARGWTSLQSAIADRRAAAAAALARRGGSALLARLAHSTVPPVPLQPVLRDVWRAHVLFEGPRLTGLIDFHAAGIDSPAADLSRLLGSWEAGSRRGSRLGGIWEAEIGRYVQVCPLRADEIILVDLLHVGGVVGALENWFVWVIDEGREFASPLAVEDRIDFLLKNLDSALAGADALLRGPR